MSTKTRQDGTVTTNIFYFTRCYFTQFFAAEEKCTKQTLNILNIQTEKKAPFLRGANIQN